MKYFIDTEFVEGPQKESFPISLFRKNTPPMIDLISIGIVAEDVDSFSKRQGLSDRTYSGREYYAISKDFNLKEAWNRFQMDDDYDDSGKIKQDQIKVYWLRDNVLKSIWRELFFKADSCLGLSNRQTETFYQDICNGEYDQYFTFKGLKNLISHYGKTNKEIAEDIISFTKIAKWEENPNGKFNVGRELSTEVTKMDLKWDNPEFYAYYADYDWVVFCWIFGKMMDLPDGFPMYCRDLKQELDDFCKNDKNWEGVCNGFENRLELIKSFSTYPKQENEHNALEDARWNKRLYDFLNSMYE